MILVFKRFLFLFVLFIFILSINLNSLFYFLNYIIFKVVHAENIIDKENLVLILVEKDLYKNIKDEIRWYSSYINKKGAKTIVYGIDKDITAKDILVLIESIYFDGKKDGSLDLIGISLIGDVPLPVVNKDGFIFPSIYPYVNLENKKYVYDKNTGYFIYKGEGKANIGHSIIKFRTLQDYKKYFERLKQYDENPASFVDKKFFYEDLILLKEYFDSTSLPFYLNKLIFSYDLSNHHFTNLLFKILNYEYQSDLNKKLEETYQNIKQENMYNDYGELNDLVKQYFDKIDSFLNKWIKSKDINTEDFKTNIPTALLNTAINGFIRNFFDLISPTYIERIDNNLKRTGRWTYGYGKNTDMSIFHVMNKDEISISLINKYNYFLMNLLNKKIEEEKYYMKYPILKDYYYYYRVKSNFLDVCPALYYDKYENFYFGKYVGDINDPKELTIYRGTYKNIEEPDDLNSFNVDDTKSIGNSFGVMSRQVEANRGYNVFLAENDSNNFQNKRCSNDEDNYQRTQRFYGGYSILNVNSSGYVENSRLSLKNVNYKDAWNPSWDKNIGGPLFDIAGSVLLKNEERKAYSFEGYREYSSVIKVYEKSKEKNYCKVDDKSRIDYVDFFDIYGKTASNGEYIEIKIGNKSYKSENTTCVCYVYGSYGQYCSKFDYNNKHIYEYKLISTLQKNISPTKDEIKSFNQATEERPIDDPKNLTFLGIGGNIIKLEYPNFFEVEVYKKQGNKLILKSIEEIKESIKVYLRNKIQEYNQKLLNELNNKDNYYNSKKQAFDFLSSIDNLASPNRNYNLIPLDYFEKNIGEENIHILAEALYYNNLGWSERPYIINFLKRINYLKKNFNLDEKLRYIYENYLSEKEENNLNKIVYIGKNFKGYEAGYIRSNGNDTFSMSEKPEIINFLDKIISEKNFQTYKEDDIEEYSDSGQTKYEKKCGISNAGTVPLFQWPSAFACWLSSLPSSFKIRIGNECSFSVGFGQNIIFPNNKSSVDYFINNKTSNNIIISEQFAKAGESKIIKISFEKLLGDLELNISGDSCTPNSFMLNGFDLCKDTYKINLKNKKEIEIQINSKKAGVNIFKFKNCIIGDCNEYSYPFYISPNKVENIRIISLNQKFARNIYNPIKIEFYDKYGNLVTASTQKYRIEIQGGKLIKGNNESTYFDIDDFKDTTFFIIPNNDVKIRVYDLYNKDGVKIEQTYKTVDFEYKFEPNNLIHDIENGNIVKLKLKIFEKGCETCLLHFVTDINSNLKVGYLSGNDFIENNYFYSSGILNLAFKVYKAGNYKVSFNLPLQITYSFDVLPGKPYGVNIEIDKSDFNPGETFSAKIKAIDKYGNEVKNQVLKVGVFGSVLINGQKNTEIETKSGIIKFSIDKNGGNGYIYAYLSDISLTGQLPDYKYITSKTIIWPKNLNVMYLTLAGNDRGNLWGYMSSNSGFAVDIQASSSKNLGITTAIVDPKKLRKVAALIKKDGTILNFSNLGINLTYKDGKLYYIINGNEIDIGNNFKTKFDVVLNENINLINFKDGVLTINGDKKLDLNNGIIKVGLRYNGKDFEVIDEGKIIGHLKIYRDDNYILNNNKLPKIWSSGTTNSEYGLAIFIDENLEYSNKGVESDDVNLNIGFNEFPNIVNWALGDTLGQATLGHNEFTINFGDIMLKRISDNEVIKNTVYDGSIGKVLYESEEGNIKKVESLDFNRDGYKDLLIVSDDGKIKLLKNYSTNLKPFRELGDFIYISEGIKEIYGKDVDGDKYDDIVVLTNKGKLRVYKNRNGQFDVDGIPLCLNVNGGPDNIDVQQIFVEDMDGDGKVDIVVNDYGKVKIFYGDSYISKHHYICDSGRKNRLQEKEVINYSLSLSEDKVYDDSLIRYPGLKLPENNQGIYTKNNLIPEYTGGIENISQLYSGYNNYLKEKQKYVLVPLEEDVYFAKIVFLDEKDPIEVYKKFEKLEGNNILNKGDLVKITVYFINKNSNPLDIIYLENLKGAWDVLTKQDGSIDFGTNISNYEIDNFEGYVFKLSGKVNPGINYISRIIRYRGEQTIKIDVGKFVETSNLPQIKLYPIDGCTKKYLIAVNNNRNFNRDYNLQEYNLQQKIDDYINEIINNQKKEYENIQKSIENKRISDYFEIDEDISVLELISSPTLNLNLNVLNSKLLGTYANKFEKLTQNLCNGISLGSDDGKKCSLEPPFNISFFTPGIFNVFGCPVGWDRGRTVIWFPGTKWLPCKGNPCCVPVPMINMTSPSLPPIDPPNQFKPNPCPGVYPSKIRLYISPTLTMGLGVALCFGLYSKGIVFPPNPWGNIKGNCIVFGFKKSLCKDKKNDNSNTNDNDNLNENIILNDWQYELGNIGECNNNLITDKKISPLNINISSNGNTNYNSFNFISSQTFLRLDFRNINAFEAKEILLKPGNSIKLSIQGGNLISLVDCIIKKWLDNQIRYIINALTNMTIYVYLPDLNQLGEGFSDIKEKFNKLNYKIPEELNKKADDISKLQSNNLAKNIFLPKKQVFKEVSNLFSNPFKLLAKYFEDVPLIKFQTRPVIITVPWLSEEEFEKQKAYLIDWYNQNKLIYEEWKLFYESIKSDCEKYNGDQKVKCYNKYKDHIRFYNNLNQVFNDVQYNLKVIDEWQKFPLMLYDYIHIIDKLLNSIICIINNFYVSLINWLNVNSVRFEKWVDFIILMIAIMKTWQILIDFSVRWKRSCSKCRVDNYDFYDCLLGVFCIDLPILPIPPFRLPDIYLDLTNINIGLNIILPEFKIQPINLPFLSLPMLPRPSAINISFNLPRIPRLPLPPTLPAVNILIPTPKINLPPLLPPAPQIPQILPPIRAVVNIAEWIGKIWCIIKNGIGLVAEWNVKTRIEQLTQRNTRRYPFDFFQLTLPRNPFPRYYDVKIDSYVNLNLNFDMLYQFVNSLSMYINSFSRGIIDEINKGNMKLNEYNIILPDININLDKNSYSNTGMYTYDFVRNYLNQNLKFLPGSDYINKIVNHKSVITVANSSIYDAKSNAIEYINQKRMTYLKFSEGLKKNGLKELYDKIKKVEYVSYINEKVFNARLFEIDNFTKNIINNSENPTFLYLSLNKKIVDGIYNKLNDKDEISLGMSKQSYDKLKIYFKDLKNNLDLILSYNNQDFIKTTYSSMDISKDIKGFYVKTTSGYVNVINDLDFGTEKWKKKNYIFVDVNKDNKEEIILWDEKKVYIKYANQNDKFRNQVIDDNYKYIEYKPINKDLSVNGLTTKGTNYDNLVINFDNSGDDGYLLKMVSRIDYYYDNNSLIPNVYNRDNFEEKYVLLIPNGIDKASRKLDIDGLKGFIFDLEKNNKIIVKNYNNDEKITVNLSPSRKWFYLRVFKLKLDNNIYKIYSSSSRQVLAGRSAIDDKGLPNADIFLIREKNNSKFRGTKFIGYINTRYKLEAKWTDNLGIKETWIEEDGKIIKRGGNVISINVYYDKPIEKKYNFYGLDYNGNINKIEVTLSIKIPKIEITNIKIDNTKNIEITSKLTNDIDDGIVRFYVKNENGWKLLTGTNGSDYIVNDIYITGGKFNYSNELLLKDGEKIVAKYDKDKNLLTLVDKNYNMTVDITNSYPLVIIQKDGIVKFKLYINPKKLIGLNKIAGNFDILNLSDQYGNFSGGKCILDLDLNMCKVFISSRGQIYIPKEFISDFIVEYENKKYIFKGKLNFEVLFE